MSVVIFSTIWIQFYKLTFVTLLIAQNGNHNLRTKTNYFFSQVRSFHSEFRIRTIRIKQTIYTLCVLSDVKLINFSSYFLLNSILLESMLYINKWHFIEQSIFSVRWCFFSQYFVNNTKKSKYCEMDKWNIKKKKNSLFLLSF